MIYTRLIPGALLLLVADSVGVIGMILSDAIWLAAIPAVVSVLTLATTIVLAFLTRKNTFEIANAKAAVDETKADVKKTHDLVNSQSARERELNAKFTVLFGELAELRGKTAGIETGLAAGKVTADEKTDAFEKGLGMVQAPAAAPTATARNLEKVSDHLEVMADQMKATGENTETVRDNTKANEDNTAALEGKKPRQG